MPSLSDRVQTFTDSVIRRMTRISDAYGAINLSQGFPDYDPPQELLDAPGRPWPRRWAGASAGPSTRTGRSSSPAAGPRR